MVFDAFLKTVIVCTEYFIVQFLKYFNPTGVSGTPTYCA